MRRVFFLVLTGLLSACAETYPWGGNSYDTPEQAIAAYKTAQDNLIEQITPSTEPLGGTALVVIPSREMLKSLPRSAPGKSHKWPAFVLESWELNVAGLPETITKSMLFNSVRVLRGPKPDQYEEDYLISLDFPDFATGRVSYQMRATSFIIDRNYQSFPLEDQPAALIAAVAKAASRARSQSN